jgi:hypothetical protein
MNMVIENLNKQKMLHVKWTENEQDTFYVDRDIYSKAHDNGNTVTLKGFSGEYTFDKQTKSVTLDTGTEKREKTVVSWKIYETPTTAQ